MRKLSLILLCCAFGCLLVLPARADVTPATSPSAVPAIDHMVYLSFLPSPDELMADAKVNGLTVLRLDQTAERIVVSYQYPDGHTATLGYALLGTAGGAASVRATRVQPRSTAVYTQTETVVTPEPEIVYVERPYTRTRVVYRDRYDDFWPPLILGLGIGYISGHHGGHHHSGWRGYHGRGGWRH